MKNLRDNKSLFVTLAVIVCMIAVAVPVFLMTSCHMVSLAEIMHLPETPSFSSHCTMVTDPSVPAGTVTTSLLTLLVALVALVFGAQLFSADTATQPLRIRSDVDPPPPPEDPRGERLRL